MKTLERLGLLIRSAPRLNLSLRLLKMGRMKAVTGGSVVPLGCDVGSLDSEITGCCALPPGDLIDIELPAPH